MRILPSLKNLIVERSIEEKYVQSVGIIQTNLQKYHPKKQVITFSGGKDSTLLLFMVRNECLNLGIDPDDILILYENTGIEYPETRKFVRELKELWELTNFIETKPEKSFFQCTKEYGWPRPKSNRTPSKGKKNKKPLCCEYLKERPGKRILKNYDCVYLGITAVESHQRQMRAVTHGTCYFAKADKIQKVHPLLYFTEQEVWDLSARFEIPHNKVYDYGIDRCGCWLCTAFKKWKENLQLYDDATGTKMYPFVMSALGQEVIQ